MAGAWENYYRRWPQTTQEHIDPALLELLPSLARLTPPANIIDKTRYSAFVGSRLLEIIRGRRTDGLVITGSESDVCVLSTVLSAGVLGYPVTLVTDAVC